MRPTSRVLSTLCLALTTPSLAIGPWLVCDTSEFVEKLWPTYAAAHAAAVAALRNDAPPGAWRSHRYLVCSMSNRGLGNKLLFELMPCARVAFATGRALVVRTERHIAARRLLGRVRLPGSTEEAHWAPRLAVLRAAAGRTRISCAPRSLGAIRPRGATRVTLTLFGAFVRKESSRETLAQGKYGESRRRSSWRGPGCSSPT